MPASRISLLFALPLFLAACQDEGGLRPDSTGYAGISYSSPVVGAKETYIRFLYGSLKERDTVKTYGPGRMTLEVLAVTGEEIRLRETRCYESDTACHAQELKVDRKTGKVRGMEENAWSPLTGANRLSAGLFSEDPARVIAFDGYSPKAQEPVAGVASEYRTRTSTYRNVTVLADPTDIPIDAGGRCLILTRGDRVIEMLNYQVYGIDGGWEVEEPALE
jgi:hypothetical protein